MDRLRFAIFGTGSWARYQLAGWRELGDVECTALYNRTRQKAAALAEEFGISRIYDDPVKLVDSEDLDFMDVITDIGTHSRFVQLGADRGIPVICQEPMAQSLSAAEEMTRRCRDSGVPFYVHENWRWQSPIREVKRILSEGALGELESARISIRAGRNAFPTRLQYRDPAQFILMEMGSHILDTARFLFGEPTEVSSNSPSQNTVNIDLELNGPKVACKLEYAEDAPGAVTLISVEAANGSVDLLDADRIEIRTAAGVEVIDAAPLQYEWSDSQLSQIHASIVPCSRNLVSGLCGEALPETTGEDNLKTARLVFGALDSVQRGDAVRAN